MKKTLLIVLILLGWRQITSAQGFFHFPEPDLTLNVDFSPVPGSPGTNSPTGSANYWRSPFLYILFEPSATTNAFNLSINVGTNRATDGWIFIKQDNGSFQPLMELTNEAPQNIFYPIYPIFPPPGPGLTVMTVGAPPAINYGYAENFEISTDQIQSLVAGKWYVEVEYDNDQYLAQLTPASISPPSASISISPVTIFPSGLPPFSVSSGEIISPLLDRPATVILSAADSTDPFYLPLQCQWRVLRNSNEQPLILLSQIAVGNFLVSRCFF